VDIHSNHEARINKKGHLRDSLKCETHFRFQAKYFESYQRTFVYGGG